jgi:hypothetical protein
LLSKFLTQQLFAFHAQLKFRFLLLSTLLLQLLTTHVAETVSLLVVAVQLVDVALLQTWAEWASWLAVAVQATLVADATTVAVDASCSTVKFAVVFVE